MKDDGVYLRHVLRCIARIEDYTAVGREGDRFGGQSDRDLLSSGSLGGEIVVDER